MVGLNGFEPATSPLSGVRSNQLSYRPILLTALLYYHFIKHLSTKYLKKFAQILIGFNTLVYLLRKRPQTQGKIESY